MGVRQAKPTAPKPQTVYRALQSMRVNAETETSTKGSGGGPSWMPAMAVSPGRKVMKGLGLGSVVGDDDDDDDGDWRSWSVLAKVWLPPTDLQRTSLFR